MHFTNLTSEALISQTSKPDLVVDQYAHSQTRDDLLKRTIFFLKDRLISGCDAVILIFKLHSVAVLSTWKKFTVGEMHNHSQHNQQMVMQLVI